MSPRRYGERGTKLKDYTVDGVTMEIMVQDSGKFTAYVDGTTFEAPSLGGLTEKLRKHVKAHRRVSVPAVLIDDWEPSSDEDPNPLKLEKVVLIGTDGRTGSVRYRDEDGDERTLHYEKAIRPLSPDDEAELRRLVAAGHAAMRAVYEWVDARIVHAKALLTEAQAAAAAPDPNADADADDQDVAEA